MSFPEGLWSAIRQRPHDDEPRLQLADWLDEHDAPRGEFIRLQVQLERVPLKNPLRLQLESRERELLADHETEWLGGLGTFIEWAVFHRGFPSEISIKCDEFLRHGANLLDATPIEMLHLSGARDMAAELSRCETLRRVAFLDLSNNHLRDPGVRVLSESPNLFNLEGLNLSSTAMGDAGARSLAASTGLRNLRELYLCDNRITRAGLKALAAAPFVQRLDILSLRFNESINTREPIEADVALQL